MFTLSCFDRNWESQPQNKFKAKSWYIFNSSSASATAMGHTLQLSSVLSFRSNFLSAELLRICTIWFCNFFAIWFCNLFFIIWFSTFWVQDFWEIVQSDFAEHPTLFFNSASTAKQRVNMNFVLRSVSWFHAVACTLLKTLSRGHNISRWSLHDHWVTMPKVSASETEPSFKKICLLLMLMPDTQKA